MKAKLTIGLLVLALLCSCATNINKVNADGSPIWTTVIPESNKVIYGVGKAKLSTESNSQMSADANARADLARKIDVSIKESITNYTNDAAGVVKNAYEQLLIEVVSVTMKGVTVEQRWTSPDGTVWSLVSFPVKKLPSLYADSANDFKNKLAEKKIAADNKLEAQKLEISKDKTLTDAQIAELLAMAESLKKKNTSDVDAILLGIDGQRDADSISKYLATLGFDLSDN